ncbi:MAG TPA: CPBP family intramembrane glutamic endopeptidase [Terriglobales bacterium]|nr:CPBP family intramembrane glutamic endopeptidase [Terriglobales bacterium]
MGPSYKSGLYLAGYALVYAVFLVWMHRAEGFDVGEPLLVLGIVGIGFTAIAWLLTRHVTPFPFSVRQPSRESLLLAAYLVALAAFIAWGFSAIDRAVPTQPAQSAAILAGKLAAFVLLPLALFRFLWGYRFHDFFAPSPDWRRHILPALGMTLVLILFQLVFGRGLGEIRQSGLPGWALAVGAPLAFVWLMLEVGLVEEFFFRVLLQSRLAAWLDSETGGIVLMSLLFGLAHAPGLYFRTGKTLEAVGPHPSWLMAVGYSIVITSLTGFFLGVLWARTRNLLLMMVVHAATDLVPNLVPMIKNWF